MPPLRALKRRKPWKHPPTARTTLPGAFAPPYSWPPAATLLGPLPRPFPRFIPPAPRSPPSFPFISPHFPSFPPPSLIFAGGTPSLPPPALPPSLHPSPFHVFHVFHGCFPSSPSSTTSPSSPFPRSLPLPSRRAHRKLVSRHSSLVTAPAPQHFPKNPLDLFPPPAILPVNSRFQRSSMVERLAVNQ